MDRSVEAFVDIVRCLDNQSLALVFWDVINDGKSIGNIERTLSFC